MLMKETTGLIEEIGGSYYDIHEDRLSSEVRTPYELSQYTLKTPGLKKTLEDIRIRCKKNTKTGQSLFACL